MHYMKSFKDIMDRVKCYRLRNPDRCPMMKERLERHIQAHHSTSQRNTLDNGAEDLKFAENLTTQGTQDECSTYTVTSWPETCEQETTMSPFELDSEHRIEMHNTPCLSFSNSVQSDFIAADLISETSNFKDVERPAEVNLLHDIVTSQTSLCTVISISQKYEKYTESLDFKEFFSPVEDNYKSQKSHESIKLERKETVEVLAPKYVFYKEHVKEEVNTWLQDLPIWSNLKDTAIILKEEAISLLIDEIHNMRGIINEEMYEERLKTEISKCLERLPIWITNSKHNQSSHKETYNKALLKRIQKLNNFLENQFGEENIKNEINFEEPSTCKSALEKEIINWLTKIEMNKDDIKGNIPKENIVNLFLNRLSGVLHEQNTSRIYKLTLKGEIVELLLDLPIHIKCPKDKMIYLNKLASELTNELLKVLGKSKSPIHFPQYKNPNTVLQQSNKETFVSAHNASHLKNEISKTIENNLPDAITISNIELKEEIINVIMVNIDKIKCGNCNDVKKVINNIIYDYTDITTIKAAELAETIIMNIKQDDAFNENISKMFIKPRLSGVLSVYNTEDKYEMFTSTPKKEKKRYEDIPKFNPEETDYTNKLSTIIGDWINTLPVSFDDPEDAEFKKTIIRDLAVNLTSAVKYNQMVDRLNESWSGYERQNTEVSLKIIIFFWLQKLNIFDHPEKCNPEIDDLYERIDKIPVPILTKPQHGTRQMMAKTEWLENENIHGLDKYYVPKGIDVLEDNISMWMNQQSDIFTYNDQNKRESMVKKLACDVQERLVGKHSDKEIMSDIASWLNYVIKPNKKAQIPDLIEELAERFKNIPQDMTLYKKYSDKHHNLLPASESKQKIPLNVSTFDEDLADSNRTMKGYIAKFIQTNYEIDDPVARKVLSYILKKELIRIGPAARQDIYNNSRDNNNIKMLSVERFGKELEYIKVLSDWLNTIPADPSFNVLKNKDRINFIHCIARYCVEIEDEIIKSPNAMDYDSYLLSLIISYIVELPISKEQKFAMCNMAQRLFVKIKRVQNSYVERIPKPVIDTEDLGTLINWFVQEYGKDIGDDPLKLEVWIDRLTEEIKNIAVQTIDPTALGKTQIYKKLAKVPIPGNETVELFEFEIGYAKEITDWLKNLPLKDDLNKSEEEKLVKMISELSDKMIERRVVKLDNPTDVQSDRDIVEFIKQWISELPLNKRHDIIMTVVIQQLMSRMDRVNKANESKMDSDLSRSKAKSIQCAEKCIKTKSLSKSKLFQKNPESAMIEAVEKFCNSLVIQANNESEIKTVKDNITKRLLEKISKLNIDASVFNDELLFKEMFANEVDIILENLPQNPTEQKNSIKSKKNLIDTVVELENIMKEQSAGENYKQKLENTIEASIPNPIQMSQTCDPGFEFYKNRLATMFILENFDHADADIKTIYEKRIQTEIDKYFEHAVNRNAIPLSKDRIQNELYSVLFKVPIPNELSIAGEVEEAKTRFEIDAWYELLPLKPTNDLAELLERDKILSALARRIHEIEKTEKDSDANIHKEITLWLKKLPLLPGNIENIEQLTNQLKGRLKSSAKERKRVSKKDAHSLKKGKSKGKRKSDKTLETSKTANKQILSDDNKFHKPEVSEKAALHKKPAADQIIEAVENWCKQLPLPSNNPEEIASAKSTRNNLVINIILKISELNTSPEIFPDDYAYDTMLDQEIERLIYNLPLLCDYATKQSLKTKLREMIMSIKPLIVIEREQQEYKNELEYTVRSILEELANPEQGKKVKLSKELVEKIIDSFLEYTYNIKDIEKRNVHKSKIQDIVAKYLSDNIVKLGAEEAVNPVIIGNELICKMSKISPPSKLSFEDTVEAMRLKLEVHDFFIELGFSKEDEAKLRLRDDVIGYLVVDLYNLGKNDHNNDNESMKKQLVTKCLDRLDKKVNPEVIDAFVQRLRKPEKSRKVLPPRKPADQDLPYHDPMFHPPIPNLQQIRPSSHRPAVIQTVPSPRPAISHPPSLPINEHVGLRSGHQSSVRRVRSQVISDQAPIQSSLAGVPTSPVNRNTSAIQAPDISKLQIEPVRPGLSAAIATGSQQYSPRVTGSVPQKSPVKIQSPAQQMFPRSVLDRSPVNTSLSTSQRQMVPLPTRTNSIQQPITQDPNVPSIIIPPQPQRELSLVIPPDFPVLAAVLNRSVPSTKSSSTIQPSIHSNIAPVEHIRTPMQTPQNFPRRAQREPVVDSTNGKDVCKCNRRKKKKKIVCIRGRDFDQLECYPPPFMWGGIGIMGMPGFYFC